MVRRISSVLVVPNDGRFPHPEMTADQNPIQTAVARLSLEVVMGHACVILPALEHLPGIPQAGFRGSEQPMHR